MIFLVPDLGYLRYGPLGRGKTSKTLGKILLKVGRGTLPTLGFSWSWTAACLRSFFPCIVLSGRVFRPYLADLILNFECTAPRGKHVNDQRPVFKTRATSGKAHAQYMSPDPWIPWGAMKPWGPMRPRKLRDPTHGAPMVPPWDHMVPPMSFHGLYPWMISIDIHMYKYTLFSPQMISMDKIHG